MPTYEYECKHCQNALEVYQSFDEAPITKCPECKKKQLIRVISGGLGSFVTGRTLCIIADRNYSTYSSDQQEAMAKQHKTKKAKNLKLKENMSIMTEESKITPLHKKLSKATPEQAKTYIEKGII